VLTRGFDPARDLRLQMRLERARPDVADTTTVLDLPVEQVVVPAEESLQEGSGIDGLVAACALLRVPDLQCGSSERCREEEVDGSLELYPVVAGAGEDFSRETNCALSPSGTVRQASETNTT
jgi:hypothetical protein